VKLALDNLAPSIAAFFGGSIPETALVSDAQPLSVTGKGIIIESATEYCGLNRCNSFITNSLLVDGHYFGETVDLK